MIIDLDDKQIKLLLETLAISWQIEYMIGKDPKPLGKIIESFAETLQKKVRKTSFLVFFRNLINDN